MTVFLIEKTYISALPYEDLKIRLGYMSHGLLTMRKHITGTKHIVQWRI